MDGLHPACKKCSVVKAIKYEYEHYDNLKNAVKEYNSTPERKKIQRAKANKQRENGYQKEYQNKNPDKMKQYQEDRRHKNHKINKTEWDKCKEYFNYTCAYCGLPLSEHYYTRKGITKLGDFHKEHVDHEGGDDLSNCIPSCGSCNDQKWKFKFDEWYNEDNEKYSKVRYEKIIKWLKEDYKQYIEEYKPKRKYKKKKLETIIP